MEVKEAVSRAKSYVMALFAEEGIGDLGLEEVEFDELEGAWEVTLGFTRAWDRNAIIRPRAFKVVRVADDGKVLSVKHRLTAGA